MIKTILIFIIFIFSFSVVYSHGAGQIIEKESDGYLIDVDYDSKELRSGESVRFNFNLWNDKDRSRAPDFTDVWVRIAPAGDPGIIYAGDMHRPSFGSAGFTYVFPKSGDYELTVRFKNSDKTLNDDVVLPLIVLEGLPDKQSNRMTSQLISGIVGLIIGVFVTFIVKKSVL